VAHSIGGAATLLAARAGLRIERAVLLATPSDLRGFIDLFGEHLGLTTRTRNGMARRVADRFGIEWDEMCVRAWSRGKRPPLLVVHDRRDAVVPWSQAGDLCSTWGNAELLTTTGLLTRSYLRLTGIDLGFETGNLLVTRVTLPDPYRATEEAQIRFFDQAIEAVEAIPGVESVAVSSQFPYSGGTYSPPAAVETAEGLRNDIALPRLSVSPDFFEVMGLSLLRGRGLGPGRPGLARPGVPDAILEALSRVHRCPATDDPRRDRLAGAGGPGGEPGRRLLQPLPGPRRLGLLDGPAGVAQSVAKHVPAALIHVPDLGDAVLRPLQRCDRSNLDRCENAVIEI